MKKSILVAAVLLGGMASANAADLIIEDPAVVADPAVNDVYLQVLGGVALPGVITYSTSGDYDMNAGWGLGATLGVGLFEGLSAEIDLLHLSRRMTDFDFYEVATTSLMANLKYTVDLNDTFSVYGAVGLGHIWVTETDHDFDDLFHGSGFGYQLIAGVGAKVADNVSLIGEYRFQNTFDGADMEYGQSVETKTSALLVGAKIGF
jgi:opacity protein-like surface antigen